MKRILLTLLFAALVLSWTVNPPPQAALTVNDVSVTDGVYINPTISGGSIAGATYDYVAVADTARTNTTLTTDHIVTWTSLTATRNYQLSSEDVAQAGRIFVVKDSSGSAGTYPITITCEGGELIDGSATITLATNYASISLFSTGTGLSIY